MARSAPTERRKRWTTVKAARADLEAAFARSARSVETAKARQVLAYAYTELAVYTDNQAARAAMQDAALALHILATRDGA